MSENPYQPPASAPPEIDPLAASLEELIRLHGVARSLRCLLPCLVGEFVMLFASVNSSQDFFKFNYLVVILLSLYFTLQLVIRLKGWPAAIVVGLFVPLPIIGLLVLLVVSASTVFVLNRAGFKVGLFGVDPRQIQRAIDALEKSAIPET